MSVSPEPAPHRSSASPAGRRRLRLVLWLLLFWLPMTVCSGLLMVEGVALGVAFVTLGLGLVAWPLPTLWLYLTALWPAVLAWAVGLPRRIVVATGVLVVVCVAIVPPGRSMRAWQAAREAWAEVALDGALPTRPPVIQLVKTQAIPAPDAVLDRLPCSRLTQRLLYDAGLEAVDQVAWNRSTGETLHVTWRIERRDACEAALREGRFITRETLDAMGGGDCLVPTVGEAHPEAPWLRVWFEAGGRHGRFASDHDLPPVDDLLIAEAGPAGTPFDAPTFRRVGFERAVLAAPTFIGPVGRELRTRLAPFRTPRRQGPEDAADPVQAAFGWTLPAEP